VKPRLLDLFCGAGGSAMGYSRAGFEVVGVDINPQPHFPFEFHRADALTYPLDGFDAIHASPPCQAFSITGNLARSQGNQASVIDLLTPIRPLLEAGGLPYVIENVKGAPLIDPLVLCGSTFGLEVRRHRLFESNVLLLGHGECRHREQGRPVGVYGSPNDDIPHGGRTARNVAEAQIAMGIDWMPRWSELKESVPPAYTEWIGRQLLAMIGVSP
jgi:DNA (cytosine-5)-methyltransferase 1